MTNHGNAAVANGISMRTPCRSSVINPDAALRRVFAAWTLVIVMARS